MDEKFEYWVFADMDTCATNKVILDVLVTDKDKKTNGTENKPSLATNSKWRCNHNETWLAISCEVANYLIA